MVRLVIATHFSSFLPLFLSANLFVMLQNMKWSDISMKVISIGVATTITAYTLYSAFSAKNPFADLPKSSFNAIRSFTYDPKQKDKEREEEYPVFEKKDFIGKQALVVNDVDIAHQALAQQDRYRKGHLYGRSPLFSYVHRLLFGGKS
jgi:hypothetical protein